MRRTQVLATLLATALFSGGLGALGPATANASTTNPATPKPAASSALAQTAILGTRGFAWSSRSAALATRPAKVTVPANYVYNPRRGALHDYCTAAPDEFPAPGAPNADFRGPCARHDLCYAGTTRERTCDNRLRQNLFRNCEHYYGKRSPLRPACKSAALVYWAVVVAV